MTLVLIGINSLILYIILFSVHARLIRVCTVFLFALKVDLFTKFINHNGMMSMVESESFLSMMAVLSYLFFF